MIATNLHLSVSAGGLTQETTPDAESLHLLNLISFGPLARCLAADAAAAIGLWLVMLSCKLANIGLSIPSSLVILPSHRIYNQ